MNAFYQNLKGVFLSSFIVASVVIMTTGQTFGQDMANYVFSNINTGSLEDITIGSTNILSVGNHDDDATGVNPIGFDFYFMGVKYNYFSANSNGQVSLHTSSGATAISGGNVADFASNTITLAAMGGDNELNGGMSMKVVGTAPNRKLVIEWNTFYVYYYPTVTNAGNMQMWLNENGRIDYAYGDIYNAQASTTYDAIFVSSGNTLTTAGYVTVGPAPTFTLATTATTNAFAPGSGTSTGSPLIADLGSAAQGSRWIYSFTPSPTSAADPATLTFSAVSGSATTLNWIDNSTNETFFIVTRATDAAFTANVVTTIVPSTTTAAIGGAYNSIQTGLSLNTVYYYKVQAANEGMAPSNGITGSQSTTGVVTYTWNQTGTASGATPANWTPARNVPDATDILIVDGTITPATIITDVASQTIGQLIVKNNANVQLQSNASATTTISGGPGTDLDIQAGSTLELSGANSLGVAFTGTQTATVAGTLKTSTAGTATLDFSNSTTTVTGTFELGAAVNESTSSTTSLSFAAGATCKITSNSIVVPTATWAATANLNVTGVVGATSVTHGAQNFGNFTYNCPGSTATLSWFGSSSAGAIQGDMNVLSTGAGTLSLLTSGTLTVAGNLTISSGTVEVASGAGTLKVAGTFNQAGSTLTASAATNSLEFNGSAAQNVTFGTVTGSVNVRVNNAAGINMSGTLAIGNGATLTISNGNITGPGVVTYDATASKLRYNGTAGAQTATAIEFPATNGPVSLTINNTSTSPNNVVNIPFNRSLAGTSGVLTLTAGILNNTGNVLTVTNTATGGISGGGASAFVMGALERTLPASLATGSTYTFPVGKAGYNQVELVNPTTNAGGTVTVRAEAFDGNAGGTNGSGVGALSTTHYWAVSTTAGAVNLTNTALRLYEAPGVSDGIANSTTQTGVYAVIGGGNPVVTATSVTTGTPLLTALSGFYLMALRASPVISNLAVTPTGNQCANVTRTVTVTVTPGSAAAITGVVINYSVNSVAQTPITMTPAGGNNWTGTIPTVTPVNASVTWSVTATDAANLTKTQAGTAYNDVPLFGITAVASASSTTVCAGSPTTLTAAFNAPGSSSSVGTGTGLTGDYDDVTAFGNRWPSFHMQMLFTAAELSAAGLAAGNITAITFNTNTQGSDGSNTNYEVSMGATAATALTDFISTSSFTTVFPAATYTHVIGLNTITFSTPYTWNGTSNIVINLAYNGIDASTNAQTYYTTTAANTVAAQHSSNGASLSATRPNIIFAGVSAQPASAYSWSNGSTTIGTTNPLVVSPTVNTTYTATLTNSGCSLASNPVTVTASPLPSAPSATNSTQCSVGVPTLSVASTAGAAGSGTFLWYSAASGGTLLQGPAYGSSLVNYYSNNFSSAVLTNSSISGNASIASGTLTLTPPTTSQQGGLTVNASGINSSIFQTDFDLSVTSVGGSVADGLSYSFGDDASATSSSPAAEHGSGSKLKISFDTYDAANGNNGMGVYVMYNATAPDNYTSSTQGVLLYSTDVSWVPTSAATLTSHVTMSINAAGQLSLSVGAVTIASNLQLPPAFLSANKSSWKHVFSARSGGIEGGFAMNNLVIQANTVVPGYTTYQSSVPGTTTFYVSELGVGGCESPRTPVTVTFSSNALTAAANPTTVACLGSSTSLSVTQTGSTNNYTLTWTASPSAGSGIPTSVGGSLASPTSVTPTATGTYTYTITGVDGVCNTISTVNVTVNDPNAGITATATATPNAICAGNPSSLSVSLPPATSIGNSSNLTGSTDDVTAFGNRWPSFRMQMLFTASELNAAGIYAGPIQSMTFNISSIGDGTDNPNYTVMMGSTTSTALTGYESTAGYTTVFPAATYTHAIGLNTINFSTPYSWNGSSNIVVDITYLGADQYANAETYYTATAVNTVAAAHSGNSPGLSVNRPNVIFGGTTLSPTSYSWSDGSTTVGTTNPLTVIPATTTNYTATLTVNGCPLVSNAAPVTVTPIPALAAGGASGGNTQGPGSTYFYTDPSCNLIGSITTTASNLGAVTAGVAVDGTVQTFNGQPYLQRHFVITPTTQGPATVKLYALQSEFDAYNLAAGAYPQMPTFGSNSAPNIANVKVTKFTGSTPGSGNSYFMTPTSVFWNGSWWEITVNVPSFSGFFIHTGNVALNIKLVSIDGQNFGRRNKIDWVSSSEDKGAYYVVQRSIDGVNFVDIGTVATTGKASSYSLWDENPATGLNHYRLKMIDLNKAESFSRTVDLVVKDNNNFVVEAFPNPVIDVVNVKVYGNMGEEAQVQISDVSGKTVRIFSMSSSQTTIDMSSFASGLYFVKYSDKDHSQTNKINKQ